MSETFVTDLPGAGEPAPELVWFEDFEKGMDLSTVKIRRIRWYHVWLFAVLSGDWNPLHLFKRSARPGFPVKPVHGMLAASMATGMGASGRFLELEGAVLRTVKATFKQPFFRGDSLRTFARVAKTINPTSENPGWGIVWINYYVNNQNGELIVEGQWTVLVKSRDN